MNRVQKEEIEYKGYKPRTKPKKNRGKLFLGLAVGALCIVVVLFSPIFAVTEVVIGESVTRLTYGEIAELSGIDQGVNIFTINKRSSVKGLKENPYVDSAEIKKELPSTVYINIVERKVRGYVPYMGSYLYIDEYGRVLDVKGFFTDPLPVVKGLEFDSFQLGEKIEADNKEAFDVVVIISQIMTKYEMLDLVVNLDVSDTHNITAKVNKVDVNLGTISDCDEKIRTMAAIISEIPEDDRGTLDLSDLSKPLVFKYLT